MDVRTAFNRLKEVDEDIQQPIEQPKTNVSPESVRSTEHMRKSPMSESSNTLSLASDKNMLSQAESLQPMQLNYLGQPNDQESLSSEDSHDDEQVEALKSQNLELREGLLRFSVKTWKSVMAAEQSSEGYLNIIAELERKQEEIRDAYALVSEDFEEEQAENDRVHNQNQELVERFNIVKQTNENLKAELDTIKKLSLAMSDDLCEERGSTDGDDDSSEDGEDSDAVAMILKIDSVKKRTILHWRTELEKSKCAYEAEMAEGARVLASLHRELESAHSACASLTEKNAHLEKEVEEYHDGHQVSASTMRRAEEEIARIQTELDTERKEASLAAETAEMLLQSTIEKYESLKHETHISTSDIIEKLKLETLVLGNEKKDLSHKLELKSKEYQHLSEKLKKEYEVKAQASYDEFTKLQDNFESLKIDYAMAQTQLEEQRNVLSENSIKIASLEASLDHVREEARTVRAEKDKTLHALSASEKECVSLTSNLAATREMLSELREKSEQEAKVHQQISMELDDTKEALQRARDEIASNGDDIDQKTREISDLTTDLRQMSSQFASFKETSAKEEDELKKKLSSMTQERNTLQEDHDSLMSSHSKVSGDLSTTFSRLSAKACRGVLQILHMKLNDKAAQLFRKWHLFTLAEVKKQHMIESYTTSGVISIRNLLKSRSLSSMRRGFDAFTSNTLAQNNLIQSLGTSMTRIRRLLRQHGLTQVKFRFFKWLRHIGHKKSKLKAARGLCMDAKAVISASGRKGVCKAFLKWRAFNTAATRDDKEKQLITAHEALVSEMEQEFESNMKQTNSKHDAEVERVEKLLFNEKRDSEMKLKATVQDLTQQHHTEINDIKNQWDEAAEESARHLDELKNAASDLEMELGVVQGALKSERARRTVSVNLVRIFTSKEKKQAHAFRKWAQMFQTAKLAQIKQDAQETLTTAVNELNGQIEVQKKDFTHEISNLKRDLDEAAKAHAQAIKDAAEKYFEEVKLLREEKEQALKDLTHQFEKAQAKYEAEVRAKELMYEKQVSDLEASYAELKDEFALKVQEMKQEAFELKERTDAHIHELNERIDDTQQALEDEQQRVLDAGMLLRDTKASNFLTCIKTMWKRNDRKKAAKGWLQWRRLVLMFRSRSKGFALLHLSKLRRDKRADFRYAMKKWVDKTRYINEGRLLLTKVVSVGEHRKSLLTQRRMLGKWHEETRVHKNKHRAAAFMFQFLLSKTTQSCHRVFALLHSNLLLKRKHAAVLGGVVNSKLRKEYSLLTRRALFKWHDTCIKRRESGSLLLKRTVSRASCRVMRSHWQRFRLQHKALTSSSKLKLLVERRAAHKYSKGMARSLSMWKQSVKLDQKLGLVARHACRRVDIHYLQKAFTLWFNNSLKMTEMALGSNVLVEVMETFDLSICRSKFSKWQQLARLFVKQRFALKLQLDKFKLRRLRQVMTKWKGNQAAWHRKQLGCKQALHGASLVMKRRLRQGVSMFLANVQRRRRQANGTQLLVKRKERRQTRLLMIEGFKRWEVTNHNASLKVRAAHDISSILHRREGWRRHHALSKWMKFFQFKNDQLAKFESVLHLTNNWKHRIAMTNKFHLWTTATYLKRSQAKTVSKMFRLLASNRSHRMDKRFRTWCHRSLTLRSQTHAMQRLGTIANKRHILHHMQRAMFHFRMNARSRDIRSKACRVVKRAVERFEMQGYRRGWYVWKAFAGFSKQRQIKMRSVVVQAHKRYIKLLIRIGFWRWQHKLTFFDDSSSKIRRIVKNAMRSYILKKLQINFGKWRSAIRRLSLHAHGASILAAILTSKKSSMEYKGWLKFKEHTHISNKTIMKNKTISRGLKNVVRIFIKNDKSKMFRAFKQFISFGAERLKNDLLAERGMVSQLKLVEAAHEELLQKDQELKLEHESLKEEWTNLMHESNATTRKLSETESSLVEKENELKTTLQELSAVSTKLDSTCSSGEEQKKQIEELIKLKDFLTSANEKAAAEKAALLEQVRIATKTAEDLHKSHEEKHTQLKTELTSQVNMLKTKRSSIHEQFESHKQASIQEKGNMKEQLAEQRAKVAALETSVEHSLQNIQSLTEQRDVLAADLNALREKHALTSHKTVELSNKLETAEKYNESYLSQIAALKDSHVEGSTSAGKAIEDAEREKQAMIKQAEIYKDQIQHMKQSMALKESEVKTLSEKLEHDRAKFSQDKEETAKEMHRLAVHVKELESHRLNLTSTGSGLEGQLAVANEKAEMLAYDTAKLKEKIASYEASEKAHLETYENAKVEIKELRAVERAYHELRTKAALASSEGKSMAKLITELRDENTKLTRGYDEAKGRLESEVVHAEELATHLNECRGEISKLEERCRNLVSAQAPLSELSEKLMEELKGRDLDSVQKGHLEEMVKSLENRYEDSKSEVNRLSEFLSIIHETASHTLQSLQDTDQEERHLFGNGGGQQPALRISNTSSIPFTPFTPKRGATPMKQTRGGGGLGGGGLTTSSSSSGSLVDPSMAKSSVDALVHQLERMADKIDTCRRGLQDQEENFNAKHVEFEAKMVDMKEKQAEMARDKARINDLLTEKGQELTRLHQEMAAKEATLVEAERMVVDAEQEKRDMVNQLKESSALLKNAEALNRSVESSKQKVESLLASREEERSELIRILHSSRFVSQLSGNKSQNQTRQHGHRDDGVSSLTREMNQEEVEEEARRSFAAPAQALALIPAGNNFSLVSEMTEFALGLSRTENERSHLENEKAFLEGKVNSQGEELRVKTAELLESNTQIKSLMSRIDDLLPLKSKLESLSNEIVRISSSLEKSAGGKGDSNVGEGLSTERLVSYLRNSIEAALEVQASSSEQATTKLSVEIASLQAKHAEANEANDTLTVSLENAKNEVASLKDELESCQSELVELRTVHEKTSLSVNQKEKMISVADNRMKKLADRVINLEEEVDNYKSLLSTAEEKLEEQKETMQAEFDIEMSSLKQIIENKEENAEQAELDHKRICDILKDELAEYAAYTAQLRDWGNRQRIEIESLLAEAKATQRLSEAQVETIKFDMNAHERVKLNIANKNEAINHSNDNTIRGYSDEDLVYGASQDLRQGLRMAPQARKGGGSSRWAGGQDDDSHFMDTSVSFVSGGGGDNSAMRERKLAATVASLQEEMEMEKRMKQDQFANLKRTLENSQNDLTVTQEQFLRYSNIINANMNHITRLASNLPPMPNTELEVQHAASSSSSSDHRTYREDHHSSSHKVSSSYSNRIKESDMGTISSSSSFHEIRVKLENDVVTEKKKSKSLADAVELEKKRVEGLQTMLKQVQTNLAAKESEVVEVKRQMRSTHSHRKASHETDSLKTTVMTNEVDEDKDRQIAALVVKVSSLNKQLVHFKRAEEKVNELKTAVKAYEAKTKALTKKCESLESDISDEEEHSKKLQRQVDAFRHKVSELEDELALAAAASGGGGGGRKVASSSPSKGNKGNEVSAALSHMESELESAREEIEKLRKEKQTAIFEAREKEAEIMKECQERTSKLQAEMLEQHRKRSTARQEELSEMADLKAEAESLASDLRKSQEEVSDLLQRISTAESSVENERAKYKKVCDELASAKETIITYQRSSADSDERLGGLMSKIDELEEKETKYQMEIDSLKESNEVRRRELQAKNNELQIALRQVDVSKEQKEYNRFLSESRATELSELQARISFLEKEKETSQEDVERLTSRTRELTDRLGNSESLRANLERQLLDVQRKHDTLFMKLDKYNETGDSHTPQYSSNRYDDEDRTARLRLEQQVSDLKASLKEAREQASQPSAHHDLEFELKEKTIALDRALHNLDTAEAKLRQLNRTNETGDIQAAYRELKATYERSKELSKKTEEEMKMREEELRKRVKNAENESFRLSQTMTQSSVVQEERDGLRAENSELRSQLRDANTKLRKANSDAIIGQHQSDDTTALTRRIHELEIDLRNANNDAALREKEYRSALESEIAAKKHADRLQHELSVESSTRLQVEMELKAARSRIANLDTEVTQVKRESSDVSDVSSLRQRLRDATSQLSDKERQLQALETHKLQLETSLTKAEKTIKSLSSEAEVLKEALTEKEEEVRGLLTLNEQLLLRAEKALEKSRERKKTKKEKP